MSPRASDKKKWAQAKSLEVEVQARPLRSESVAGEMLVAQGLHAIAAAIDQHTSKMAKHQEMAKETQCMQRQFNNCLYELLQETEYWQVVEVGESSDEERTSAETSDRETNEDVEGEEVPESDLEVLDVHVSVQGYKEDWEPRHSSKGNKWERIHEVVMSGVPVLDETYQNIEENKSAIPLLSTKPMRYSRGWHRGLEVPEEGNGGTQTEVSSTKRVLKSRVEGWGVRGLEGGSKCQS
ncbi:hypothetical protein EDC04DRAFT_2613369 [Pisolithus marmoratus]|nr:hypothetical protein EDC04DRAFT_2613369 [Pisolithus marmoratus]